MTTAIDFDDIESARTFRDRNPEYVAGADDARFSTVVLADDVPPDVLSEAEMAAAGHGGDGVTDGDPDEFDGSGSCGELDDQDLGDLRRSWGAYIGSVREAFRAYHRINDLRTDICLDPLGFEDLEGTPEDVTSALLDDLRVTDGAVPEGMSAEDIVEAGYHAETPGTIADGGQHVDDTGVTSGEASLKAATERAIEHDVSLAPDEAFHGTGAVGRGKSELESAEKAEGSDERALVSDDLADAVAGDADLADAAENKRTTPPGDLEDIEDLDGLNGWEYREIDAMGERGEILAHERVRPSKTAMGEWRGGGKVVDEYAQIKISETGASFASSVTEYTAEYREKYITLDPDDDDAVRHARAARSWDIVLDVKDREAALKEAWRFATLAPDERDSPVVHQFEDTVDRWGRSAPEAVGEFSLTDSSPDGAVGWAAPAPSLAKPSEPAASTLLVLVRSDDPETSDNWSAHARRVDPDGNSYELDGSSYRLSSNGSAHKLSRTGKSWGEAIRAAISHMRKLSDMDAIGAVDYDIPRFRIQSELRVLRPLLNATKRVQAASGSNTYTRLTVEEDELRIRVPANTTGTAIMADIAVSADDLDTYQVAAEGTAFVDAEQLWRFFTDAGLTSTLTLSLDEQALYGPPKVSIQIDGERVEVSDRSNPIDNVDIHLIPEETVVRSGVNMPDVDPAYSGTAEVATVTSALSNIESDHVWLICGDGRLGLARREVDGMSSTGVFRVGDADGAGSVLFSTDLLRDQLRAIPRQSGKELRVKWGASGTNPGEAASGPATLTTEVGNSNFSLLVAPRVVKDEEDLTVPVGHEGRNGSDVIPRETE